MLEISFLYSYFKEAGKQESSSKDIQFLGRQGIVFREHDHSERFFESLILCLSCICHNFFVVFAS